MHEFGITERLFQVALTKASLRDGERIRGLLISLDPDSGYAPDAIRFYFEQLAHNTPAEGAELTFELVPQPQHITLDHIEIDEAPKEDPDEIGVISQFPSVPPSSLNPPVLEPPNPIARWRLQVTGDVQIASFQLFLQILTYQLSLNGWVRRTLTGIELEVQGPAGELDHFLYHLRHDVPPPARIEDIKTTPLPPLADQPIGLEIRTSQG